MQRIDRGTSSPSTWERLRKLGRSRPFRIRDVDASERVRRLQAASWSVVGLFLGVALSVLLVAQGVELPLVVLLALPPACAAFVYFGTLWIGDRAGAAAGTIYNPSGDGTPHLPEFSYAESLAARGRWEDAVHALREAARDRPDDPRPLVRAARILRDDLGRAEEAATVLRQIRRTVSLDPGMEILLTREVAEIYLHRLGEPVRAAPELARLAERYPGTPAGEWARRTLGDVRRGPGGPEEARVEVPDGRRDSAGGIREDDREEAGP